MSLNESGRRMLSLVPAGQDAGDDTREPRRADAPTPSAVLTDLPAFSYSYGAAQVCLMCQSSEHPVAAYLHQPGQGLRACRPICLLCRQHIEPLLEWLPIELGALRANMVARATGDAARPAIGDTDPSAPAAEAPRRSWTATLGLDRVIARPK